MIVFVAGSRVVLRSTLIEVLSKMFNLSYSISHVFYTQQDTTTKEYSLLNDFSIVIILSFVTEYSSFLQLHLYLSRQ